MKTKDKDFMMKITTRGEYVLKHPYTLKDDGNIKWWAKILFWFKGL